MDSVKKSGEQVCRVKSPALKDEEKPPGPVKGMRPKLLRKERSYAGSRRWLEKRKRKQREWERQEEQMAADRRLGQWRTNGAP